MQTKCFNCKMYQTMTDIMKHNLIIMKDQKGIIEKLKRGIEVKPNNFIKTKKVNQLIYLN